MEGHCIIARPLSPITYFRRNLNRALPFGFVIVLSVFLIASVVTIVNSIDLTVLTIYSYTRIVTPAVSPPGHLVISDETQAAMKKYPQVDRIIQNSAFLFNLNTVFGGTPFACMGVSDKDRDYLLTRAGDRLIAGRMPAPGAAEAVVSEGIVRNRKLKIGDDIANPSDDDFVGVPVPVKLVGILQGPTWMAFTSSEFTDSAMPLSPRSLLITTKDTRDQTAFADTLFKDIPRSQAQIFSFNWLVNNLRSKLSSMYVIMGLVNGMVIFVVALMAGMLSNIYFTQRISEFAMLSAIGLRRAVLIWHAVSETAIITFIGWGLGVIVNWCVLSFLRGRVFEPRGMLIDPGDPLAYAYTLPIPIFITLFAVATVSFRLSRLDPVSIIERR